MPRIILFLALAVMALAACSSGDPPDPRGPATDSATILPGSPAASSDSPNASPQSGPDITASTDDHGYGQGTVFQIEYLGAVAEYTNNELVDLIVLEHYIADRIGESFELDSAVFSVLAQVQSASMAFLIAPEHGVAVDPDVFTARVRSHLGLDESGEQSAGDKEFDEKFNAMLEAVGITGGLYQDYVRKSLFLEGLQARIESQEEGLNFQQFLNEALPQFKTEIALNSDINAWINEQVHLRVP